MDIPETGGMTMQTRFLVLLTSFALAPFLWPMPSSAQIAIVPGSASRGQDLFRTKACIDCHSFNGAGGKLAPDLAQQNENARTPMQLASVLWNHGPRMWQAQKARHIQPTLDSAETADLFAYFYSLSYSKAPGDAARGARLFTEKSCAGCHETTASARPDPKRSRLQSPISTWQDVNDPLVWAEHMWNHSGKVYAELSSTGSGWLQFSGTDMADLLAYIRSLPESRSRSAVFQPGNPELGRVTFERSCESCHSFGESTADPKIDLLKKPGPSALTDYIAAMWNHAPQMHSRAGDTFPILGPGDMRNLVAYLFAQRYFDEQGNVQRGARVFEAKNCAGCHEQRRKETGATDLTLGTERFSPITISAAVWRHGPSMFETIQKQNLTWPELKPSEMSDLIAYLNSRLVRRIAK
jgi:mono/diheme cytochrome c family protein